MNELKTMNAEELAAQPFPPPAFIVDNLIPMGLSVLGGASKTGKSWLMLWLAMRVSQGLPVWDRPTKQCDVLYLCLEDSFARIQRRMYQLSEEEPLPSLRFAVLCEKLREGLEEQITSHLRTYPATGLVIIDTLQKVRPVHSADAGNMYACDYEDMTLLKSMADRCGIAVLVVHHLRKTKDKDDPFNELSGSNGLMGALDTSLLLRRGSRDSANASLRVTGRDVEDQELLLTFDNCVWGLSELEEDPKQEYRPDYPPFLSRVTEFMKGLSHWEGTATELLEAVVETEIKPKGVVRCLSRFFYEYLEPRGIRFHSRRTGQSRLIALTRSDANDDNDANDKRGNAHTDTE